MDTRLHLILTAAIAALFTKDISSIALVACGAGIIDFDHLLYSLCQPGFRSLQEAYRRSRKEAASARTHLYAFHNAEFLLLFLLIGCLTHPYALCIAIGFAVHFLQDIIGYLRKSSLFRPWWQHKSLIAYAILRPDP